MNRTRLLSLVLAALLGVPGLALAQETTQTTTTTQTPTTTQTTTPATTPAATTQTVTPAATSVRSVEYAYNPSPIYYQDAQRHAGADFDAALKADAATELEEDKSRASTRQVVRALSGRIASKLAPGAGKDVAYSLDGATGMNAGEQAGAAYGLWHDSAYSILSGSQDFQGYNGGLLNMMAGFDVTLSERFILGLGLGWEHGAMGTELNGQQTANGFLLTPYAAVDLYKMTLLEVMAGFSWHDVSQGSGPDYNAFRAMFAAQLAQHYAVDNWRLACILGWQYTHNDAMHDRVRDVQIGELSAGGKVGYVWGNVEPYLMVKYIHDTLAGDADPDDVEGTLGLDFALSQQFFLNVEAANMFFRDREYNTRLLAHLRYQF